jgi:hypothetical protein
MKLPIRTPVKRKNSSEHRCPLFLGVFYSLIPSSSVAAANWLLAWLQRMGSRILGVVGDWQWSATHYMECDIRSCDTMGGGILFMQPIDRAMANKKNIHTVPTSDGWAVKREGASRASSVHKTQDPAWEKTQEMARREGGEAFLHGAKGQIRERNTYPRGRDKCPPRG